MIQPPIEASIGDAATVGAGLDTVDTLKLPTFPEYHLEGKLGEGTFGKVYRAHHHDTPETTLALKVLQTQGSFEEMLREPAMLAKLDHPGIVKIVDYFPHDNKQQLVLAMEYIGGGDLKTAIDESTTFPPELVRNFLIQIGRALQHAHQNGIIHRDLKPANILLDRSAGGVRYVLSDFGVGLQHVGVRHEKKLAGTYLYMAPEQLRGRPVPESDLWSLGVVAYRMLSGAYPFPGPTPVELMKQIQFTTPMLPSQVLGTAVDHELELIILRLLDRAETERIGSAKELLKLLGDKEESSHRSVSVTTTAVGPSKIRKRMQTLDAALHQDIRRNYLWMIFWIVLTLISYSVVSGVLMAVSFYLIYRAHQRYHLRWKSYLELVAAGLLLGGGKVISSIYPDYYVEGNLFRMVVSGVSQYFAKDPILIYVLTIGGIIVGILSIFFPVWASAQFARIGKLKRDQLLLTSVQAKPGSGAYLQALGEAVNYRMDDVTFHLKYAEALAASGRDRDAAVEARLLLDTDPYHFTGNLFLAQCYYRLGLYGDSLKVCNDYLTVAGYGFEFTELRDECQRRLGGTC